MKIANWILIIWSSAHVPENNLWTLNGVETICTGLVAQGLNHTIIGVNIYCDAIDSIREIHHVWIHSHLQNNMFCIK